MSSQSCKKINTKPITLVGPSSWTLVLNGILQEKMTFRKICVLVPGSCVYFLKQRSTTRNKNIKLLQRRQPGFLSGRTRLTVHWLTWSFVRPVAGKKANNANWNEAIRQPIRFGTYKVREQKIIMYKLEKYLGLIYSTWTKELLMAMPYKNHCPATTTLARIK